MISRNPFGEFRRECEAVLSEALKNTSPELTNKHLPFEKPPTLEFGQLASSICFELAKQINEKPFTLAERLIKVMDGSKFSLIERVVAAGGGYINFYVNFAKFSALTLESIRQLDAHYGLVENDKPLKIIVEHTSVNPLHPIHIGQARNPMLGDALVRMLKSRGHKVSCHYYIDDVG
ncbi:MAG: arginine--tRNA ligase, partial [Candidatus Bathyarchaeia archaeon]